MGPRLSRQEGPLPAELAPPYAPTPKPRELREVLSQPTLIVPDGQKGFVMSSGAGGETIELEIQATVLEGEADPEG